MNGRHLSKAKDLCGMMGERRIQTFEKMFLNGFRSDFSTLFHSGLICLLYVFAFQIDYN